MRQTTFNPVTITGGSELYTSGASRLQKSMANYGDRIEKRARNKAINELLQTAPTADQTALDYNNQQRTALAGISGVDPLQALNLANVQSNPYFKNEAIQLDKDKTGTVVEGADESQVWYNPLTNESTTITTGLKGGPSIKVGNLPTSYREYLLASGRPLKPTYSTIEVTEDDGYKEYLANNRGSYQTSKDPLGKETTTFTPKPVLASDTVKPTVKYPTLSQKDSDTLASYDQGFQEVDALQGNLDGFNNAIVGPYDTFQAWADNTLGLGWSNDTAALQIQDLDWDVLAAAELKADSGASATDDEYRRKRAQYPQSTDSENVYKEKAKRAYKRLYRKYNSIRKKIDATNPGYVKKTTTTGNPDSKPVTGIITAPDGTRIQIVD